MQIRPLVQLRFGRINEPVRIPMNPLLVDAPRTFIPNDISAGITSLSVQNSSGFLNNKYVLIGEIGNGNSEIVQISTVNTSTNVITLLNGTIFPHNANTPVYMLYYGSVQISNAPTVNGIKTVLATPTLIADQPSTDYNDVVSTGGYYYARYVISYIVSVTSITRASTTATVTTAAAHGFHTGESVVIAGANEVDYNGTYVITVTGTTTFTYTVGGSPATPATGTITATVTQYSPYSDPAPYDGYTISSARSIIDKALDSINKSTSSVLTDEFAFAEIDNCQMECLREYKRWSFMQQFNVIIGEAYENQLRIALPENIDINYSTKSIYNFRMGRHSGMEWVDKEEWDALMVGIIYTTLAQDIALTDTSIVLTDSSDFTDTGVVAIGPNQYSYSANNRTTNTLTIDSSTTTNTEGEDATQYGRPGLPGLYTVWGGYAYFYPQVSSQYANLNFYLDYYMALTQIQHDSDNVVVPDPTVVQYFLEWKFLKKLNNGEENPGSLAAKQNYLDRRETMKKKEWMNRKFIWKPYDLR